MKILLVGGGTMGSVSPLIAVAEKIKISQPTTEFLFVGTAAGPEKKAVENYGLPFQAIMAGKWRRYFSLQNLIDLFKIKFAFFQALKIIFKFKPQAVMIAGSFVGVPVAWAAWVCRAPVLVHHQDIAPGLANKLMAPVAAKITVSFDLSLKDFPAAKTILTGNPVRAEFFVCDPARAREVFHLIDDRPLVLICGGGTGSVKINQVVEQSLAELLQFCQIIHLTGAGKTVSVQAENYQQFEFLNQEMMAALCAADVVVNRAGMATLTELGALAKPAIIIPLAGTHQEMNAAYFQKNNAILVLTEKTLDHEIFTAAIKELLTDEARRRNLSRNLAKITEPEAAAKVAAILLFLAGEN